VSAHWNRTRSVSGYSRTSSVSVEIASGSWLLVAGPNGVGKSTLLHAIAGTVPFMSGTIFSDGIKLKTATDRFRAGIQLVPQQASLSGYLSFQDAYDLFRISRPGLNNNGSIMSLRSHLETLEVVEQEGELSGRNFDLCLSLLSCPQVLLLDEVVPPQSRGCPITLYENLKTFLPWTTVVFIDHDVEKALRAADRVLWLRPERAPAHFAVSETEPMGELLADVVNNHTPLPSREEGIYDDGVDQNVVRLDRSPMEQVSLAVQAHRDRRRSSSSRRRAVLERKILRDFPFLDSAEPAETLSGGERTVLAWFLIEFSGVGKMREPFLHLDGSRAEQLREWMKP
jgi:ABC-type branched-subunit amino acid transport system ATPase component